MEFFTQVVTVRSSYKANVLTFLLLVHFSSTADYLQLLLTFLLSLLSLLNSALGLHEHRTCSPTESIAAPCHVRRAGSWHCCTQADSIQTHGHARRDAGIPGSRLLQGGKNGYMEHVPLTNYVTYS